MIYLDNAATSNPKPDTVWQAMESYMRTLGTSPGRGGYASSLASGRLVFSTRSRVCSLFNVPTEKQVVFMPNVTYALNTAFKGLLVPGDHVITSSMEHNSVIRPLRFLEAEGDIEVSIVPCNSKGELDPEDVRKALRPDTKMIVLTAASNVTGTLMPIHAVGRIAREAGVYYVLDTAQAAGYLDLNFGDLATDVLAFTGHKSLYGPPGTGGFVLSERAAAQMVPLVQGGTGSRSDREEQPEDLPDKFEAGTLNTVGIAGLGAGVEFVLEQGLARIRVHESNLTRLFIAGLREISGLRFYGPDEDRERVPTVSVTLPGLDLGEVAYRLDAEYGIMVRSGLHCSPLAHRTIGTFPEGTLRFSFGYFNTEVDVHAALQALERFAAGYH
ncbi:MAG: aminotransferase class V-fold PLP-dependent enzyme [bacterium]|jgi:cysteine desulfurase/selenocysteine lyase